MLPWDNRGTHSYSMAQPNESTCFERVRPVRGTGTQDRKVLMNWCKVGKGTVNIGGRLLGGTAWVMD